MNAEAIALSQRFGLSLETTLNVIHGTTATNGQLKMAWATKVFTGDVEPGFTIDLAHKDLSLIVDAANAAKVPVPIAAVAREAYSAARGQGHGGKDFSAMVDVACDLAAIAKPRFAQPTDPMMTTTFPNLINGRTVDSAEWSKDINPSNTGDVVGEFARGTTGDLDQAIASAREAFPKWSRSTPQERFDILDRAGTEILARKDELGRLLSREQGKPLGDGIGEAARAGYIFKYFAGEALRQRGDKLDSVRPGIEVEVTREPVGVVGLITPWNFPLAIPAWKIAPALAFGNCVIFKPAELVPASPWALADIVQRAGLPTGVLNLVMGPGAKLGAALASAPGIDAISFTGSRDVGPGVAAAAVKNGARVQLEMGGKNPLIVLDDADLATAVSVAVNGAYFQSGQRCTASSRIIVTEGIHDRFVAGGGRAAQEVRRRRRAQGGNRDGPGGRRPTTSEESRVRRNRQEVKAHVSPTGASG